MASSSKYLSLISQTALRQSARFASSRAATTVCSGTEVSPSVDKAASKPKLSVNLHGVSSTSDIPARPQYFSNMAPVPAQPSVAGAAPIMQKSNEDAHKVLFNASDAKYVSKPASSKWNRGFLDFVNSLEDESSSQKSQMDRK